MSSEGLKKLLDYDQASELDDYEDLASNIVRLDVGGIKEEDILRKAFSNTQAVMKQVTRKGREQRLALAEFERESQRTTIKMQNYENDMERMKKELKIFQQEATGTGDTRELLSDIARLEGRNDTLNTEVKELEVKYFQEKADKEKSQNRVDQVEKELAKYKRDCERYEEDIREYGRQIQNYRDEKYSRTGDEQGLFREKISQKNKVIGELEDENARLLQDNLELNRLIDQNSRQLKDSTEEMNRTRDDIRKLRMLQQHSDIQLTQLTRENEVLRSQSEVLTNQLRSHQAQDDAIMQAVEKRVAEFKSVVSRKDEECRRLEELILEMKEEVSRSRIDSDKTSVAAMSKALKERDEQIDLLKKQCVEFGKEMDKSAAVIEGLRTACERERRPGAQQSAEAKAIVLEGMIRDGEERLKKAEDHSAECEKELTEVRNRMREYESGDYQLQEAVNEIKALKGQVRLRDRDVEALTKQVNRLDEALAEVLEEEDELRAKLGLEPREKLALEVVVDRLGLKAIRAQESRAVVHVLKREVEALEEERNRLKMTVRKLARQLGTKVNVASIIDEDFFSDSNPNRPSYNKTVEEAPKQAKSDKPSNSEQLMKKRNEQLMQVCLDFENENKLLEKGLKEIHTEIVNINKRNEQSNKKGASNNNNKNKEVIKCPSLDKLLVEMEQNRSVRSGLKSYAFLNLINSDSSPDSISLAFKAEIDFIQGRNEELRIQTSGLKNELRLAQIGLAKAEEEAERLRGDVKSLNKDSSAAKDIFRTLTLPEGMAPSSQDVIAALNEYLIDTLQELDEYRKLSGAAETQLEALRRKYSVARHQISLLYNEYIEAAGVWKKEKARFEEAEIKRAEQIAGDSAKLQEYERLLDTLEKGGDEVQARIAEASRQTAALRYREKLLTKRCSALEDAGKELVAENKRLRVEAIEAEVAVQQRLGYLERFRDMANFRVESLQKQLGECVGLSKLELVNREYGELVVKYRQMMERDADEAGLAIELRQKDAIVTRLQREVEEMRKELETEKEKGNLLEERLERFGGGSGVEIGGGGDVGMMARRLAAVEMKELSERQRAEHAQRMYDEQRVLLRQVEDRCLSLEATVGQLNKGCLKMLKNEEDMKEELSKAVTKQVSDQDKARINELQHQENILKLEVSRLRELAEITVYQTSSLEFINNLSGAQLSTYNLLNKNISDGIYDPDLPSDIGKLHRQIIMLQISEATAVRKLQQAQQRFKKLETQLIRAEQKHDRDSLEFYNTRKEQLSKVTYLRATVQDLRHKYAGAVPLKQQEALSNARQKLTEMRTELAGKLATTELERVKLEDSRIEFEARSERMREVVERAAAAGQWSSAQWLESFNKSEGVRMMNLRLERAARHCREEVRLLEERGRRQEAEIAILEEAALKHESDMEAKQLIWEAREADLERTCTALRHQQQQIENLALNFEELSGNMPDPSMPVSGQLDQALTIIRSHVRLLAEAKIQSDLSKTKNGEMEKKIRVLEAEVTSRDKAIADLRLRMPASADRDSIISRAGKSETSGMDLETPVRAAQATIEGLQARLRQKELTLVKYQEMLKTSREEMANMNRQHEQEVNSLLEKLNLTRDSTLQRLKHDLRQAGENGSGLAALVASRGQLERLQELEEVCAELENSVSALQQKNRRLQSEAETWKARHEALTEKSEVDMRLVRHEKETAVEKLKVEVEEMKNRLERERAEADAVRIDLQTELSKKQSVGSGSLKSEIRVKSIDGNLVEDLKSQLAEKETKLKTLQEAMVGLKSDLVGMAKSGLVALRDETGNDRRVQSLVEKSSGEYRDKICGLEENVRKLRVELKAKILRNEELEMELKDVKEQMRSKELRVKKLTEENAKLVEDGKVVPTDRVFYQSQKGQAEVGGTNMSKAQNEQVTELKRQVRVLEEKLKRQSLIHVAAERPYEARSPSPVKKPEKEVIIRTVTVYDDNGGSSEAVKRECEQWKTRYNFVVSENTVLMNQNKEMEAELKRFQGQIEGNASAILKENQRLRLEVEKLAKSTQRTGRSASPGKTPSTDSVKMKKEIDRLKEKNALLIEELVRARNNEDNLSQTSSSSVKRVGESGKSTVELERTISLMKKMILKLQKENESLKLK